jgi:2',3'-cyclic-nucleotide 2'-phosphodiesterase (5'-nucleotidase family)
VPVLVLDSGNALFKTPMPGEPKEKERATLLLEQMDALGTTAMAVGMRDLTLGLDFLTRGTKGRKMKLLSANLVDAGGKPLFPASTVVTVGGVKFGLVGLSPEGPVANQQSVVGRPPVPAGVAEARRLRQKEKVDVVVVLAAVPYLEAVKLSREAGDSVDFILQSHESRGAAMAQRNDFASLIPSGERGRQLARLELSVDGPGPFADLDEATRAEQNLKILETNLQQARQSLAAAKDEQVRKTWQSTIDNFETRRKGLVIQTQASKQGFKRTHRLSYILLGGDFVDDPELKQRVERIQPPGSASH